MTPANETDSPDEWAVRAASLPLAFSQVREDPRVDLALVAAVPPGATMAMIASGGDTAACLRHLPLRQLHLVDMNPAQLALSRCKWHLAGHATTDETAAMLGHLPMPAEKRRSLLAALFHQLEMNDDVLGPLDFAAEHGPDHAGRYERAFAELRRTLSPQRRSWDAVLDSSNPEEAARLTNPSTELGQVLDAAFAKVMRLANLVRLFGMEATQNPRMPFSEHFAWRTRAVLGRLPAWSNPFLWQIFAGRFPVGHRYDWLQPDAEASRPSTVEPVWHQGKMRDMLDAMPASSAHLVHLSNILDWLAPHQAEATLRSTSRVLKPGGRVILRQLNSTLDIPRLECGIIWDQNLGAALEARDRSFFYPLIHVGTRA